MADRAPDLACDYDLPRVVRDHMVRWVPINGCSAAWPAGGPPRSAHADPMKHSPV